MALTNFLTTDKALASVLNDKVVTPANAHISTAEGHIASTSNPHSVTKTQVGLSNVTNDEQIPKSIIDAAGDLIYGTADNTPARLAKGTDGQILKLASGLPSWGDATKSVSGTYIGNGAGGLTPNIVSLGFTPDIVIIGTVEDYFYIMFTGVTKTTNATSNAPYEWSKIITNGFQVATNNSSLNVSGRTYYYCAIK